MEYTSNGVPISPWQTKTDNWRKDALTAHSTLSSDILPNLQTGFADLERTTNHLSLEESTESPSSVLLDKALDMRRALEDCRRAIRQATAMLDKIDQSEMDQYTELLQREVERENGVR